MKEIQAKYKDAVMYLKKNAESCVEENSKEWNELYDKLYTIDGLFQKLYELTNDIPEVRYSNTPRRLNNASIAMYLTSFISIGILPFTK